MKKSSPPNDPVPFRLSPKVTLNHGDKIRVSAGPYYVTKTGAKLKIASRGKGIFLGASEDGKTAKVLFNGNQTPDHIYIGPEYLSELTGTTMRPHKIVKVRK